MFKKIQIWHLFLLVFAIIICSNIGTIYARINNPSSTDTSSFLSSAGQSVPTSQYTIGTSTINGELTVGEYTLPYPDGTNSGQVLKTDGMGSVSWQEDLTTGNNIFLYFHDDNSDIANYEDIKTFPGEGSEVADTGTSTSGSYGIIDSYISTTTDITITSIPAGTWQFHTFANVGSDVGNTYIVQRIYARNGAGVERLLYTATSSELTTGAKEYQYSYVFASSTLSSERLVVKNYCWSNSVVQRTCTFYYDGKERYSHIITPLTSADLGYTRKTQNEIITGTWQFTDLSISNDLNVSGDIIGATVCQSGGNCLSDISPVASTTIRDIGAMCTTYASSTPILSGGKTTIGSPPFNITVFEQNGKVIDGTSLVLTLNDGSNYMSSTTATSTRSSNIPSVNTTWNKDEDIILEFGTNTGDVTEFNYCAYYYKY